MVATNLKIVLVVLGTLGVYTLVANSIPQVQSEVPEELSFAADVSAEELVAAGEELYDGAGGCTACHGLGTRAPNLLTDEGGTGPIGARCAERVPGQECKDYLYESMVDPAAHLVEGYGPIMPDQRRTLSNEQIWALVAYLQSVGGEVTVTGQDIQSTAGDGGGAQMASAPAGGGAAAAPGGGGGDPSDPVSILENNLCLGCHTLGDQGVELGPPFDGMGARLTADEIRTGILDPNAGAAEGYEQFLGTMPPNFGEMLTAAQLEAVVRFLASQR